MTSDMSRKLQFMLCDLEINQLQTILVPSKRHDRREWDCVRVNVSVNCKWYRSFCSIHASKRGVRRGRFDTIVRRRETLKDLDRLLSGHPRGGVYEERILEAAKRIKI